MPTYTACSGRIRTTILAITVTVKAMVSCARRVLLPLADRIYCIGLCYFDSAATTCNPPSGTRIDCPEG